MGKGLKLFQKMLVALLSVVFIASSVPVIVNADGGNSFSDATSVTMNKQYTGTFTDKNRLDTYKLDLQKSGTVTIKYYSKVLAIRLFIYEGNNTNSPVIIPTLGWDSSLKQCDTTLVYALNAGTYYLQYDCYNPDYTGSYNFTVSFKESGETFKEYFTVPNNDIKSAAAINLNTNYTGFIAYNDSIDYFKFTLNSDSEVSISVTTYVTTASFGVCNSSGTKIKNTKNNDTEYIMWNTTSKVGNGTFTYKLTKGTYYFFAQRTSVLTDYLGDYSFKVSIPGWQKDSIGWWYQNSDGSYPKNQFKSIGNRWYYFEQNGYMVTGWRRVGGIWYYFNSDGVMQTGWVLDGGHWYYFNKDGALQYGWQNIGGKYYYFKSDGTMAENEYCGGYWLGSGGAWTYKYKASWKKDSTGWWYGDDSGWYAKNETIKIDGKNYNFNARGYCTNP